MALAHAATSSDPVGGVTTLAVAVAVATFLVAYQFEQPLVLFAPGTALIAGIIAWSRPFLLCALFVAFTYFRLSEAYPILLPAKPAFLLGAAAVAMSATKVLLSDDREGRDIRRLRALGLVILLAVAGLAYPYTALRPEGRSASDVIIVPIIMILGAACAMTWWRLMSATADAPLPINMTLCVLYFAVVSLGVVFSAIPPNSFLVWSGGFWKIVAMTLAISWMARSEQDFNTAYHVFWIGGALVAAVAVYNSVNEIGLVEGTRVTIGRLPSEEGVAGARSGLLSDPNDLALILLFPLAFASAYALQPPSRSQAVLAASVALLILAAIIATQSRGAMFGVAALAGMLLLVRTRSLAPALLAVVLGIPLLLAAMNISERQYGGFTRISELSIDESAQGRLDAWLTAINMTASRPLTGVGIGNFVAVYHHYSSTPSEPASAVHSMWFEVLAEGGILAFVLYVAMIITSFRINARTIERLEAARAPASLRTTGLALQGALAGTCASGTFLSQGHSWPIFITVALIAALVTHSQTHVASPKS